MANNKTLEKADLGRVHCSFIMGMNSYFSAFFFFSKSFWGLMWISFYLFRKLWRVFWAGFEVLEPFLKGTESTLLHFLVVRLACRRWSWSKLVIMQVLFQCSRLVLALAFILILGSSVQGKTQESCPPVIFLVSPGVHTNVYICFKVWNVLYCGKGDQKKKNKKKKDLG